MAETPKLKPWTDAEKLGLIFQIVEQHTILWDTLTLPEGRTKKACMVMVDKEKAKVRSAKVAEKTGADSGVEGNDEATPTPKAKPTPKPKGGKRKTDGDDDGAEEKPKATKKTKKVKAEKAAAGSDVKLESDTDQE